MPTPPMRLLGRAIRFLARRPRIAAGLLRLLQRLPVRRIRTVAYRDVAAPLAAQMEAVVETPVVGGNRMRVDTRDVIGRMLAASGVWEPHVTAVFRRLLSRGDVCVDVGANIGYYTLLAARLVGKEGHVYAFEPAEAAFDGLTANLQLNGVRNVSAARVAVGAAEAVEFLQDRSPGHGGTASIRRSAGPAADAPAGSSASTPVPVGPLAALIPFEAQSLVRLVKIDVEGFEREVLEGLEPLYESGFRPAVLVEVHVDIDPSTRDAVTGFCRRHRLKVYVIVDEHGDDRRRAATRVSLVALSPEDVVRIRAPRVDLLLADHPPASD